MPLSSTVMRIIFLPSSRVTTTLAVPPVPNLIAFDKRHNKLSSNHFLSVTTTERTDGTCSRLIAVLLSTGNMEFIHCTGHISDSANRKVSSVGTRLILLLDFVKSMVLSMALLMKAVAESRVSRSSLLQASESIPESRSESRTIIIVLRGVFKSCAILLHIERNISVSTAAVLAFTSDRSLSSCAWRRSDAIKARMHFLSNSPSSTVRESIKLRLSFDSTSCSSHASIRFICPTTLWTIILLWASLARFLKAIA